MAKLEGLSGKCIWGKKIQNRGGQNSKVRRNLRGGRGWKGNRKGNAWGELA